MQESPNGAVHDNPCSLLFLCSLRVSLQVWVLALPAQELTVPVLSQKNSLWFCFALSDTRHIIHMPVQTRCPMNGTPHSLLRKASPAGEEGAQKHSDGCGSAQNEPTDPIDGVPPTNKATTNSHPEPEKTTQKKSRNTAQECRRC